MAKSAFVISLDSHFSEQVLSPKNLTCNPKSVTDIDTNRPAIGFIPSEIVDGRFKSTIKVDTDQLSRAVDNWTPRISTGGVGVIENTGRDIVQCGMAEPAKFLLSVLLDNGFREDKGS